MVDEGPSCNMSTPVYMHPVFGKSCSDECCRSHDACCAATRNETRHCNTDMLNCVRACDQYSLACSFPHTFIPFPIPLLELAMDIVHDRCCSSTC
jgi:hypothetical protein